MPRQDERSRALYAAAQQLMPGGVSSPVRAFRAVGGAPFYTARGEGPRLTDADGNEYLDYVGCWGAAILGHAPARVVAAVEEQAKKGLGYGTCTELEVELAEKIRAALPGVEMVRFVVSGTEATMSAIRLARAATGRQKILKFEGCYHGHADAFLSKAGSGLATFGIPSSPGVPEALAHLTLHAAFNDAAGVEEIFARQGNELAAVMVEPVAANMGVVPPAAGFLEKLGELTRRHGALLIFDEVITGFRVAYGGAQTLFGIEADLTTLGKIIGGGLPVGAYGGRRELMEQVAPLGPVYQAGTLAGNPLALRAGLETLRELEQPGFYERLNARGTQLAQGLRRVIAERQLPLTVNALGSLATVFFTPGPVRSWKEAEASDTKAYGRFFHEMLQRGIFLAPSQFEAMFVSAAHSPADIDRTVTAFAESATFDGGATP